MKSVRVIGILLACLLATMIMPAFAGGPQHEVRTVDTGFVRPDLSATCGFTVTERSAGAIEDTIFTDAQGNVSYILEHYQLNDTFSANGHTLTSNANGPARIEFNADGSITLRLMGTGDFTTAPGQGVVHGDAGLIIETIPISGPPTVELHGLHITSESGFCAALAP